MNGSLGLLDGITAVSPTWTDETRTRAAWGPWREDGVRGRLYVEQQSDGGPADLLTMHPVSTEVNNVRNNGPDLIAAL